MNLIFVTGTARSGTSAVAGLLERMGAQTLPSTVVGPYNPDYQESIVLNALSIQLHPWHKRGEHSSDLLPIRGMAAYILEHWHDHDRPMAVKCPNFPFIIHELYAVARTIGIDQGVPVIPAFVCVVRSEEQQIPSLQEFTSHNWSNSHWRGLLGHARFCVRENVKPGHMSWVVYEKLLEDWKRTATMLAKQIKGLTVPEDGGIRNELNHHGVRDAQETESVG